MAEWLKTSAIARRAGYSECSVQAMIHNGVIPPEYIARKGKRYVLSPDVIPWLIEHKRSRYAEQAAPEGTQYVADPNGEYLGFELTPDEAARLKIIREAHNQYPSGTGRLEMIVRMLGDG